MSEFTDGTMTGNTLSLQECYQKIEALKNGKSGTLTIANTSTQAANGSPCATLTAPEVEGYNFLCWVMIWTDGSVVHVHSNHPEKNVAPIWATDPSKVAGLTIMGMALYVKEE